MKLTIEMILWPVALVGGIILASAAVGYVWMTIDYLLFIIEQRRKERDDT